MYHDGSRGRWWQQQHIQQERWWKGYCLKSQHYYWWWFRLEMSYQASQHTPEDSRSTKQFSSQTTPNGIPVQKETVPSTQYKAGKKPSVKPKYVNKKMRGKIFDNCMYCKFPYSNRKALPWGASLSWRCLSAGIHRGGVPRRYHDLHTSVAQGQPRLGATWLWYSTKWKITV